MALQFAPKLGEIVMCDFPPDGQQVGAEMCKTRPVIVLNKALPHRHRVVNVVPISLTPPNPVCAWHVVVPKTTLPQPLWAAEGERWAKCDMVCTVSLDRLNLIQGSSKDANKRKLTFKGKLDLATLDAVRLAVAEVLVLTPALFQRASPDPVAANEAMATEVALPADVVGVQVGVA